VDIGFTGNYYPYRGRFFAELSDLPITIWGRGWEGAPSEIRRLVTGGPAWGREKLLSFSLPKIVLNLHHPLNDILGVNDRLFEVASCGGFQLTDWREDVGRMFEEGKEIVVYRDADDCRRLVEYYLRHPEQRAAIAAAGQRRAHENHTVSLRLTEIMTTLRNRAGRDDGGRTR
jgi:spore maturation protein CgeB